MTETLKNKSNLGGKREGSGRPKGSMNKATKEKKEAEKQFKDRVKKNVDRLFDSQMTLAQGCAFLFRISEVGEGKSKKRVTEQIDTPTEIQAYLDGDYEGDDDYYYISTEKPSNMAIDSLMNRAFGKPLQKQELSGEVKLDHTTIYKPERYGLETSSETRISPKKT